ncbi:MAG: hypothetical protein KDI11_00655 [Alphaproteobacteria bacterium]|nr:hypothetical protein [Alphaproteobacteria bacterium]
MSRIDLDQNSIRRPIHEFWEICAQQDPYDPPINSVTPIEKVLIVGGERYHNMLGSYDRDHLRSSFSSLMSFRIPISNNFHTEVVNIVPHVDGRDFLDPELTFEADLLIISYIPKSEYFETEACAVASLALMSTQLETSPFDNPDHPHAWREAAIRTGAKVITAFGRNKEVGEQHIRGQAFGKIPYSGFLISPAYAEELGIIDQVLFNLEGEPAALEQLNP